MKDKKFLIAEGSENCALLTQKQLEAIGIEKEKIVITPDGVQTLEMLRKELFDVVIISPILAKIDGIDLAYQIKSEQKEHSPKIIASSCYQLEQKHSFDGIVRKPQKIENLHKEILHVLMSSEKKN